MAQRVVAEVLNFFAAATAGAGMEGRVMAWIKVIEPEDATGDLKAEYDKAERRAGKVFNILKVQSLNPQTLNASIQLYLSAMHGASGLSRAEREMLGTVVSWANHCFY